MIGSIPAGLDFFNFLSAGPVIMYISNGEKFVWANAAFQQFTEYSIEELIKMNFWEMLHPDHWEVLRKNAQARLRGEIVPNRYELRAITKSGTEKWVDIFLATERVKGQVFTLFGAYNITERKKAELALQAAHDQLEQQVLERTRELIQLNQALMAKDKLMTWIIEHLSEGILIVNQQGEIEFVNQSLETMLNRTFAEMKSKLIYEKLVSNNSNIRKLLQGQRGFLEEEVYLTVDSREMQFLASGTTFAEAEGASNKAFLAFKPLSEVHRLVNRYSGVHARIRFDDILTRSELMLSMIEAAKNASRSKSTILVQGESGTGKEMFAQAIHNQSPYADGPFIAINCGAIPRELVGSELFGYVEGAFTGARKGGMPGKFELAQGGTLFLDEIGDMPLEQQVALLRVIQEKQVCRLGGSKTIPVDVRLICSTNKNLYQEVQNGNFRQDLYYRLDVISLRVPPLRERQEDINLLLKHFLAQGDKGWLTHLHIDREAQVLIQNYPWPGNVRELQNFAEKIRYSVKDYSIGLENLPSEFLASPGRKLPAKVVPVTQPAANIKNQIADLEQEQIESLLRKYNGKAGLVAEELGVSRRTIDRRIKKYGIKR